MPIPDLCDIESAIEDIAAGLHLDPTGRENELWVCALRDRLSDTVCNYGFGLTMREAAASAWIGQLELGHLLDAIMRRAMPVMPDGRWRFEACPPGCWEIVNHALAVRSAK
jgi:hypothetical protein